MKINSYLNSKEKITLNLFKKQTNEQKILTGSVENKINHPCLELLTQFLCLLNQVN